MENNTANSPNSPVLSNCSSSTDQPPESGDFTAATSVCRFIFPSKFTLPSSLSSTPTSSTLSNYDNDDSIATMQPFNSLAQLEELEDQLRELNKEIDSLHRENAQLRSENTDLLNRILNPSFFPNVDFMPLGGFGLLDGSAGSDEASSDVSPTSVIHRNQFIAGSHFSLSNLECPRQLVPESQKREVEFHVIGRSSCGAADERVDNNNVIMKAYNQGMRKTELCNKWERSGGACPYGENCQFAHGMRELRPVVRHPSYKTKICRMILTRGTCPYGHRCHFRHSLNDKV